MAEGSPKRSNAIAKTEPPGTKITKNGKDAHPKKTATLPEVDACDLGIQEGLNFRVEGLLQIVKNLENLQKP